jgi:hypothetical protein
MQGRMFQLRKWENKEKKKRSKGRDAHGVIGIEARMV